MTGNISAQAIEAGTSGNVASDTITQMRSSIPGINTVTNPAAFYNGTKEETDSARKARFAYYIQSLARATKGALEFAAKTVTQVVAAKAIDDNRASVWRYDALNGVYLDITTSMRIPGDAAVFLFVANAPLSGAALYFGGREPFDYINMHLFTSATIVSNNFAWEYWDGILSGGSWQPLPSLVDGTNAGTGTLTQNGTVSWSFNPALHNWVASNGTTMALGDLPLRMWVRLRVTSNATIFSARPTGDYCSLPPGLGYVYLYCHDGSGGLPTSVKTAVESAVDLYRGCGITVVVLPPSLLQPPITISATIAANYDMTEMQDKIQQTLVDWLSTKVLGEDLFVAEIYHKVMGMDEKAILNCQVLTPTSDIIVPGNAVIRPNTSLVTVNVVAG